VYLTKSRKRFEFRIDGFVMLMISVDLSDTICIAFAEALFSLSCLEQTSQSRRFSIVLGRERNSLAHL
jgi:hypothetical protein